MTGLAIGLCCALGTILGSEAGQAGWETVCRTLRSQSVEAADWAEYYKCHSSQINLNCYGPGSDCNRIYFNPVFVSPAMQWAVPNSCLNGPPSAPPGLPPGFPH